MSHHVDHSELPELSDEDVELLHAIVTRASSSDDPPYRALFSAYDQVFAEQGVGSEHDGVVFRYLLRIGELKDGGSLVERLRRILAQLGIEIHAADDSDVQDVQDGDEAQEQQTEDLDAAQSRGATQALNPRTRHGRVNGRRVSFDDAKLDETWLSQHTDSIVTGTPAIPRTTSGESLQPRPLAQPPLRGRLNGAAQRRARSTSSQRSMLVRHKAPKSMQRSQSSVYASDRDDSMVQEPGLLFQPSDEDLENNASAFLKTSTFHAARRILHYWHDTTIRLRTDHEQAYLIAEAHDRRILLKQSLDQWRALTRSKLSRTKLELRYDRLLDRSIKRRNHHHVYKAFSHWAMHCNDAAFDTRVAHKHILQVRYFRRWRSIAVGNVAKIRIPLCRKYFRVWRDRTARRDITHEQALVHYEESLERRYYWKWFWKFCNRRVLDWRDGHAKKDALSAWVVKVRYQRSLVVQADQQYTLSRQRQCLMTWMTLHSRRQRDHAAATAYCNHGILSTHLHLVSVCASLSSIATTLTLSVKLKLARRAFAVWSQLTFLSQQASSVDRKRSLQGCWTLWNENLRCRALGQRIDERVILENLYRWVLQERQSLFTRAREGRGVKRILVTWFTKKAELVFRLDEASRMFAQGRDRRSLGYGMGRLHAQTWHHEESERQATELRNARLLPSLLATWREQANHGLDLNRWAQDANYYRSCIATLHIWRERTTVVQKNRKKEGYVTVRARIKIRMVRSALDRWRSKTFDVGSMSAEAERRAFERVQRRSADGFATWREKASKLRELHTQAKAVDHGRLLQAAFSALSARLDVLRDLDAMALAFRAETDEALALACLKKMLWRLFQLQRLNESSEALWARNRDAHVRRMIRCWATKTVERRGTEEVVDQPSPSLRPATRLQRSGSAHPPQSLQPSQFSQTHRAESWAPFPPPPSSRTSRPEHPTRPSTTPATQPPAYLRTPSRSRRAIARFRAIPTPAPFTPFAPFSSSYQITTRTPGTSRLEGLEALTPQVTPFNRKLRAAGLGDGKTNAGVPSTLRGSLFGRSTGMGGTGKSVRFGGASRFGGSRVSDVSEEPRS